MKKIIVAIGMACMLIGSFIMASGFDYDMANIVEVSEL